MKGTSVVHSRFAVGAPRTGPPGSTRPGLTSVRGSQCPPVGCDPPRRRGAEGVIPLTPSLPDLESVRTGTRRLSRTRPEILGHRKTSERKVLNNPPPLFF